MRELLSSLADCRGAPGFETDRQEQWLSAVSDADRVWTDAYGNAAAAVDGEGPTVVVTAHADEIGYQVREIDDRGYLRLNATGRTDETTIRGRQVVVHTEDGPETGVVGQTPVQLREGETGVLYVDVGASDSDEARERVSIGDPVTVTTETATVTESRLAGRMDNSVGLCLTAKLVQEARERSLPVTVVSTVQEEIGVRGARMIDLGLTPDVFLAVDVDFATDYPGVPSDARSPVALGDGPVLGRGMANHPSVVSRLRSAAETADVSVQLQTNAQFTGTHADALYTKHGGVPTAKVGVPCRYVHTPRETVDTRDLAATVSLLSEFLNDVTATEPEFEVH